jgi:hypothetical protein
VITYNWLFKGAAGDPLIASTLKENLEVLDDNSSSHLLRVERLMAFC